ncbi:MAG: aminoacyl-histidine dipeptidase [Sphingobacteriia bacterium]|nr:aminoacyl-histidine dipeptidase [Sphingobacteriia bacterium]
MNTNLSVLKPEAVWKNFQQLNRIPRPSKKEGKIIQFMREFGEKLHLETLVDEVGNVIIRKPATKGLEDRKGVILQAHLDMVPQANSDKKFNFETDPIEAYIDGDWVTANGTTLGADNGMGVAAAMAILESKDIQHGPIEALFTIDEETGMTGAFNLKPGLLNGEILLNMDSEDEGELYIGCAGGVNANITYHYDELSTPKNHTGQRIMLSGMKGGHSGIDIPLYRANANKLLFRFLKKAANDFEIKIAEIEAGSLRNAIPREAWAIIAVEKSKLNGLKNWVKEFEKIVKDEYKTADPDLKAVIEDVSIPAKTMNLKAQKDFINAIYACPNGVIRMSNDMEGLVETSTNMAIVTVKNGVATVKNLLRSSVDTAKQDLGETTKSVFEMIGANVELSGDYPGWKPNPQSPILREMKNIYNQKFGKIPAIKAIHAGLECGLLGGVYPYWDMISFGPTIRYPHSPDEKVHIESVKKFWDFLIETLKHIPKK